MLKSSSFLTEPDFEENPYQDPDEIRVGIYQNIKGMVAAFLKCLIAVKMGSTILVKVFVQLESFCRTIMHQLLLYLDLEIPGFRNSEAAGLIRLFFSNVFEKLKSHRTRYRSNKTLRESPYYVAPRTLYLGRRWDKKYIAATGEYMLYFKHCEFQYVSIIDTLNSLFLDDAFRQAYFHHNHVCVEGILEKFCCGNLFRDSAFFQENPNAIWIQLYYDGFTLSSASKSQPTVNLGAVYFTVQNLSKGLNSHVDNIHLVALFHEQDLKNYGQSYNKILYSIVQEIESLQIDGIDIGEFTT